MKLLNFPNKYFQSFSLSKHASVFFKLKAEELQHENFMDAFASVLPTE